MIRAAVLLWNNVIHLSSSHHPMIAPQAWQRAMQELSRHNPKAIRIGGIVSMLAGAFLLQFLH